MHNNMIGMIVIFDEHIRSVKQYRAQTPVNASKGSRTQSVNYKTHSRHAVSSLILKRDRLMKPGVWRKRKKSETRVNANKTSAISTDTCQRRQQSTAVRGLQRISSGAEASLRQSQWNWWCTCTGKRCLLS